MARLLERIGGSVAAHRWRTIVLWLAALAVALTGTALFAGPISNSIDIPGTATGRVTEGLRRDFPRIGGGSGDIVFRTTDGSRFTSAQKGSVGALLDRIADYDGVRSTTDPFDVQAKVDGQVRRAADGAKQLAAARKRIATGRTRLAEGRDRLDSAQQRLDDQRKQAAAAGSAAAAGAKPQLDAAQDQLDAQRKKLDDSGDDLDRAAATVRTKQAQLDVGRRLLDLSQGVRFVSSGGDAAIGTVAFRAATIEVPQSLKTRVATAAAQAAIPGVQVLVSNDIAQGVPSVFGPGELVGLLVAALVLVLMLRTLLGALLPLVSAFVGVGVALTGALSFSTLVTFVSVTPVLGVMLGLAVGIDYSLFIINRHRVQLREGMAVRESIARANGTSGTAVVFAGSTVVVALLALNLTGIPFLGLMGTVGAVTVAVAILVAITFTPALLSLVGARILRRSERSAAGPAAPTSAVRTPGRARAAITLVLGAALLGTVALPALQMRLGLPDGSSEAQDSSQYRAFSAVRDEFGAGRNGPLLVVADLPARETGDALRSREADLGERLASVDHVAAVLPIGASPNGRVLAYQVVPTGAPSSVSTEQLVRDLRDRSPITTAAGSVPLGVAGNASANIDISDKLASVLPVYLAVVVGLSLLILIVAFRSLLVPVIASLGFVLSLLAAFGGLTAVYQFGWLRQVFGVHDPAPLLSFVPIIEIGILFGLAMDYQLFIVSGMREAHDRGVPAQEAIGQGLRAGRAVVTAAAIIMISVFTGFVFSQSSTVRPTGFGLAFGVLVDAFVVRMLLVPAAMRLLGETAWWFPRFLDRIVPRVDTEGVALQRGGEPAPAASGRSRRAGRPAAAGER